MELASNGEVFLNPELPGILACAASRGVVTGMGGGVNLNHATDEALLAEMLDMRFFLRLNRDPEYSPVKNTDRLLELCGYGSRSDYEEGERGHYCDEICTHLWKSPQINWDGRLVDCSMNHWTTFAVGSFRMDLREPINGEAMVYARRMLTGAAPPRDDICCTHCYIYHTLAESGHWVSAERLERRGVTMEKGSAG